VGIVATLLVRAAAPATDPVPQDQPGPVLLVPGYGGDTSSLAPLEAALRTAGRTVRIVAPEGDGTRDLRAQAARLGDLAEEVRKEAGAPSVDVIGYSAGGVVARLWVRNHGGASVARRVLTLGSPHHGSQSAALGRDLAGRCPEACEQLAPDSDLLRRLNAGDETPAGPQWVTARTSRDEIVTPIDSAALEGALNLLVQDLCSGATTPHGGLPSDPVVLAALTSTLGAEPPRPPVEVTC
jgi:triacylglycerol lipase